MDSKKIKTTTYLLLALAIIVIPNLLIGYYNYRTRVDFLDALRMNQEACYEQAEQNNFSKTVCNQIRVNARDAFSSARDFPNITALVLTSIIYSLTVAVVGLKNQIEELKEKTDV